MIIQLTRNLVFSVVLHKKGWKINTNDMENIIFLGLIYTKRKQETKVIQIIIGPLIAGFAWSRP